MNIKWLEDFVALANSGSFTRAAQSRHVTQPAFSRRIRALENWLGAELVCRNAYPLQLTPAGLEYFERIQSLVADLHRLRADVRDWSRQEPRIVVATQHSLSVSYCPAWYGRCRSLLHGHSVCINALNLYECIEVFLSGHCDLLLCYVTPRIDEQLAHDGVERIDLGREPLVPVCAVDRRGRCLVDGAGQARVPLVGFPVESFLGDLVRTECLPHAPAGTAFDVIYESALTEGVRSMVLNSMGMAWLPAGLIRAELENGTLARVPGMPEPSLQIAMFRHAGTAGLPVSAIWQEMSEQLTAQSSASGPAEQSVRS